MRGRRPAGPEIVERLAGSEQARLRLRVVLETLAGRLRVQEACHKLGIGEVRFHEIRQAVLQAALLALEPKAAGRPRRQGAAEPAQEEELAGQLDELTAQLEAAQLREQIALVLVPEDAA